MINDKMKLTPLLFNKIPQKYFMPVMFARFVYALLDFCERKFPAKSGKKPGYL